MLIYLINLIALSNHNQRDIIEKDIPAQQKKEKEQARIHAKNEFKIGEENFK